MSKLNIKKFNSFFIIFIFVIVGFFLLTNLTAVNFVNVNYVKIAGEDIKVELAITQEEQIQGLSGRESLAENEGMLFVFDEPALRYFWMKGMKFPLDIIWIDEGMEVIYIARDVPADGSTETYGPKENSKYVLEVNAGFSDKYNLKVGDVVEF